LEVVAQSGDTIVFDPSLKSQTIVLGSNNDPLVQNASNEIDITKSVTIQGLGAANLAITGHGFSRVFAVGLGIQVTISGMTIEGGTGSLGTFDGYAYEGKGGGILNLGTLTLTSDTVTGNSAAVYAGGPGYGGGVYNAAGATMTLNNTTMTNNEARSEGGGIYNAGKLAINSSTVKGNSVDAAYYANTADLFTDGTCTACNSTIGVSYGKIKKC
jgi:hypothetical protein